MNIKLNGNGKIITSLKETSYIVLKGEVNVFLAPIIDNETGRRIFITTFKKGGIIPYFKYVAPLEYGKEDVEWTLIITALEESDLQEIPYKDAHLEELSKCINIVMPIGDTREDFIEFYQLKLSVDGRNIYASEISIDSARKNSFISIFNLFKKDSISKKIGVISTDNSLYNAASVLCEYVGIQRTTIEDIYNACGKNFSIQDFARISGFLCREVVLEEKWWLKDGGPLLGFIDKKIPCVLIPQKKSYYVWLSDIKQAVPLDDELILRISPKAYMFYRPFPREKMTIRKMLVFGFKEVRKKDVFSIITFAFIGALVGLLIPYINQQLYDLFIPLGDINSLIGVCSVVLACAIGNLSFSIVKNFGNFRLVNRMKNSIQAAVIDRLFSLPESFFRQYESADLATRAMRISEMFDLIASRLIEVSIGAFFSLFYLWRMFKYSGSLTWRISIVLILALVLIAELGALQFKREAEQLENDTKMSSFLYQMIAGIEKIKMTSSISRGLNLYTDRLIFTKKINLRKEKFNDVIVMLSAILPSVFSLIIFYVVIRKGLDLTPGEYIGFTTAFGAFSNAIIQVASCYVQIKGILPSFDRMRAILECLPEYEENAMLPGEILGEIELNNVSFAYEEDGPKIIDGLSLHINKGEYVGIVGPSGCGKSTLLKLLLGFEKPQTGKIYYDNKDLDTLDKRELRKKFGVVLQDGGLISGSIHSNITITSPNAKLLQVKAAVRNAGLEEDIKALPMGLHTVLSEGDGSISGGQKQRILIARAIVNNPNVLFFDEATSALDNETQNIVCKTLESLKSTKIVIAHRLSTIVNCDRIIVMDAGKIIEMGTYNELMEKKGLFYQLALRQI